MHIAYFSPVWPPAGAANGIVSYVAAMRRACLSLGHEVSVIANGQLHTADDTVLPLGDDGARWSRWRIATERKLDRWRGHLPGVARLLAGEVRAARRTAPIDLLEMEESFGWSLLVQRLACVPVVVRLHGPHFLKPTRPMSPADMRRDRHRLDAEGRAIRGARALSAPSRAVLDAATTHYGRDPARAAVIPNPVPLAPEPMRWRLDGCDRDRLLFVGRFDYWKGADTLLQAFERVVARRPSVRLTMAGPDFGIEAGAGGLLRFDEWTCANLSPAARERVRFVGLVGPDELAALRREAFASIVASRTENFPYSVFEAFAAGCPVVTTDWPGARDLVEDGATGVLTPVGDADAMAERILWLLDHPVDARRIGTAAFQRCSRSYSLEAVGGRMIEFYRHSLQERAA